MEETTYYETMSNKRLQCLKTRLEKKILGTNNLSSGISHSHNDPEIQPFTIRDINKLKTLNTLMIQRT